MDPWRRRRSPQKSFKSSETAGTADEASFHEIGNVHVHVHDHDQANHGPPTSGATQRARAGSADTIINLQELRYNAEEGEIAPGLSDAGDVPAAGQMSRYQSRYHQEEVEEATGMAGLFARSSSLFKFRPDDNYISRQTRHLDDKVIPLTGRCHTHRRFCERCGRQM